MTKKIAEEEEKDDDTYTQMYVLYLIQRNRNRRIIKCFSQSSSRRILILVYVMR